MIAQLCNSHGFFHGWAATQYHHEVFRAIVTQIEEHYTGNCIVVDDTWISKIANEETFVKMYPNVMRENVEHIFFVNSVDSSSDCAAENDYHEILQQLTTARHRHRITVNSKFQFWAYFCQQEFWQHYASPGQPDYPWTGEELFLSYNRKPIVHRTKLIEALRNHDLLRRGIVTLGNDDPTQALTVKENLEVTDGDAYGNVGIPNDITSLGNHNIWQEAFINVVTETLTHGEFLSEKIWKPIIGKRPFFLIGPPGSLQKLRDLGFKTFQGFWDESYNELVTPSLRHKNQLSEDASIEQVCLFLNELDEFPLSTMKALYHEMASILEYNYKHFFETFAMENRARMDTIIQDELNG